VTSALPPGIWKRSLDELVDYGQGCDLEGYVWGVKWQVLAGRGSHACGRCLPSTKPW